MHKKQNIIVQFNVLSSKSRAKVAINIWDMEEKKKNKRKTKAYIYIDGVKSEFKYEKKSNKLSALGIWRREHPNFGEIIDMRAVMK